MATLKLEHLPALEEEPTGGRYLTHLWYIDPGSYGRHESGELTDLDTGILSELVEVLGIRDARKARSLKPGQQAIQITGEGARKRTRLVHRIW
jgi:hypothetical protein